MIPGLRFVEWLLCESHHDEAASNPTRAMPLEAIQNRHQAAGFDQFRYS